MRIFFLIVFVNACPCLGAVVAAEEHVTVERGVKIGLRTYREREQTNTAHRATPFWILSHGLRERLVLFEETVLLCEDHATEKADKFSFLELDNLACIDLITADGLIDEIATLGRMFAFVTLCNDELGDRLGKGISVSTKSPAFGTCSCGRMLAVSLHTEIIPIQKKKLVNNPNA